MITTTAFREGLLFEFEGDIYELIKYQHHRMSQSKATVRVKMRNLSTGSVVEKGFRSEEKFREVDVQKRPKSFMYKEGDMGHFMDQESFEQVAFELKKMGESQFFLVENMACEGLYLDGKLYAIELPVAVVLTVQTTVPGVAKLETGYDIKVPLFIKDGEKIRVDTRTGEYIERA